MPSNFSFGCAFAGTYHIDQGLQPTFSPSISKRLFQHFIITPLFENNPSFSSISGTPEKSIRAQALGTMFLNVFPYDYLSVVHDQKKISPLIEQWTPCDVPIHTRLGKTADGQ